MFIRMLIGRPGEIKHHWSLRCRYADASANGTDESTERWLLSEGVSELLGLESTEQQKMLGGHVRHINENEHILASGRKEGSFSRLITELDGRMSSPSNIKTATPRTGTEQGQKNTGKGKKGKKAKPEKVFTPVDKIHPSVVHILCSEFCQDTQGEKMWELGEMERKLLDYKEATASAVQRQKSWATYSHTIEWQTRPPGVYTSEIRVRLNQ
ncbi:hypothetical protein B0H14DRAFT_2616344 [Mycena olivaceomarginata]|nr:hypothetical protein B0H14DRAFT_2616344 [Mycena olivaceomarginata]